jgi:GT2 family glycosyltransferase
MKLGVPTLLCYDQLDGLLRSAEAGTVQPTGYIIIDNGGTYERARAERIVGHRPGVSLDLLQPGENLGVAKSWNRILSLAGDEPIVIANDDVVLGAETFEEMSSTAMRALFVSGDGWCLFAQQPECTRRVGLYDERFWPAYYEDTDYHVRLMRAGIEPVRPLSQPVQHAGWSTTRALGDPPWLAEGRARNREYFIRKWGADSAYAAVFRLPFDGRDDPT